MSAQQFLSAFPEAIQTEYSGQRVMVDQLPDLFFMSSPNSTAFQYGDQYQRYNKQNG